MTAKTLVLATLVLALACAVACPRRPTKATVDTVKLLRKALTSHSEIACTASTIPPAGAVRVYSKPTGDRIELMIRSCRLTVDGDDTVDGRAAWVLRIEAKDDSRHKPRPWKQLWIDKKNHSALRLRAWNRKDRIEESRVLTKGVPDFLAVEGFGPDLSPASKAVGSTVLQPTHLPEGCELVSAWADNPTRTAALCYSNGLQAITVYQRFPTKPARENTLVDFIGERRPSAVAYAKQSGREIAVVADLAPTELGSIASSVR